MWIIHVNIYIIKPYLKTVSKKWNQKKKKKNYWLWNNNEIKSTRYIDEKKIIPLSIINRSNNKYKKIYSLVPPIAS